VAGAAAAFALIAPEPEDERWRELLQYDLGHATILIMLAAAELGIGTAHASVLDQELARSVLGRPEDRFCAYLISVGHPRDGRLAPLKRLNRRPLEPVVRGNADGWLLTALPAGSSERTRRLDSAVRWARDVLSSDDFDYLAGLPPTASIAIGDWRLLCCHGSPRADVDALLAVTSDARLDKLFSDGAAGAIACGHTHLQLLRQHGRRVLLNPGSVGLPLGSLIPAAGYELPAWAEYALIKVDEGDLEIVFRRVPVDVGVLAAATEAMPQAT
jgi:predicted phosphodiesterase